MRNQLGKCTAKKWKRVRSPYARFLFRSMEFLFRFNAKQELQVGEWSASR